MLPPKRLEVLLKQALLLQAKNCVYHNSDFVPHISNSSLLEDHNCSRFVVLFCPAFTFKSTFMYLMYLTPLYEPWHYLLNLFACILFITLLLSKIVYLNVTLLHF